jgi:hypothetical protein
MTGQQDQFEADFIVVGAGRPGARFSEDPATPVLLLGTEGEDRRGWTLSRSAAPPGLKHPQSA